MSKKKEKHSQNLKKDLIWNTIGSGINAFNSLFYMIIVTRINGVDDAGIFTLAFSTASLFNVIGIYSGRVYQVTDNSVITNHDYFINKLITCFAMLVVTFIFLGVKGYSIWKGTIVLILCLLKTFEAFSELLYAFFQKNYALYKVGVSFTLKNLIGLLLFLISDLITRNVLVSSTVLLVTYICIMFIYDFRNVDRKIFSLKEINWPNILTIFKNGFFSFCLSFLTMYIINIPRYVIDDTMASEFSTIFGIIIMPASIMVLIAQFILHPFLMKLKECLFNQELKKFKMIIKKMVAAILLFGIMVLVVAYLLGIPVLEFVYNIDLHDYKPSFMLVMVGAIMYGIIIIFSNILISMRVMFKQVVIYGLLAIVSLILSNMWINANGVEGACQSYCTIMFFGLICFVILIKFSIVMREKEIKNA